MMSYLSVSDWISIVSSIASLILAIIITVVQYKQSERMYAFERRLDERDECRHAEEIRAQVASFIIKYGDQIDLIPLCVIAAMHDDIHARCTVSSTVLLARFRVRCLSVAIST